MEPYSSMLFSQHKEKTKFEKYDRNGWKEGKFLEFKSLFNCV